MFAWTSTEAEKSPHEERASSIKRKRQHGTALLLVLGFLAMVSVLVLAFLSLAGNEQRASGAFADTLDARNLSEIPVNLVIGQIRKATEQNGIDKTWSSQPGLLRVFGTEPDSSTGSVRSTTLALYKLYSDDQLTIGDKAAGSGKQRAAVKADLDADTNDLASWNSVPGMFTDLNEPAPVLSPGSDTVGIEFPIVDPRVITMASDDDGVAGFDFRGNTLSGTALPETKKPASHEDLESRLPMPVRWMYLLQDGTLATPTGGSASGLEFPAGNVPTKSNPIVGRIAFWTDDESCKVNINTASEGQPWDVPRAYSARDVQLARRLPARNEYSRYPGHPAQTSLSPVFQAFGSEWRVQPYDSEAIRASVAERYMNLTPRIPWGGSKAETVAPTAAVAQVDESGAPKDGRLYATLDELIFDRNRNPQNPSLDPQKLAQARFFLTPHSRAPELNLFNKPRVSLWPMAAVESERNAKDRLIAFQTTLGSGSGAQKFYFQRKSNYKSPSDWGSSQSPDEDLNLSGSANGAPSRNRELYSDYLQPLTDLPVPGFGSAFEQKWGSPTRDQILTEIFDYLRFSVNSRRSGLSPNATYLPPSETSSRIAEASAVPVIITSNNTRGFGRWPTLTEVAIVFVASGSTDDATNPDDDGDFLRDKTDEMQAYLILEPFSPTSGHPTWSANVRYKISGSSQFRVDDEDMGFPASAVIRCNTSNTYLEGGNATPFVGIAQLFKVNGMTAPQPSAGSNGRTLGTTNEDTQYPFFSNKINVSGKDEFYFSGAKLTIEIQTGAPASASNAATIQTLEVEFPGTTLKVPRISTRFTAAEQNRQMNLVSRFNLIPHDYADWLISHGDTTRSMEIDANNPSKGDLRVQATQSRIPATWFIEHPSYDTKSVRNLHFLRTGRWTFQGSYGRYVGAAGSDMGVNYQSIEGTTNTFRPDTHKTAGTLVNGITYFRDCPPAVPRGLAGALNADGRPGDFDTGVGAVPDGPYINIADQTGVAANRTTADRQLGYLSIGLEQRASGANEDNAKEETGVTHSPNRQAPSPIILGSLPTGIPGSNASKGSGTIRPWQTLLFCPNPASRSTASTSEPTSADHPGFGVPRDHLLLDLFWMPVVEPYAISDGLSTAGKVNMNYQLFPFTHINRATALHAALKSTMITAITPNSVGGKTQAGYDNGQGNNYKESYLHNRELRYLVNVDQTLQGFQNRFNQGDVFRSPSEICEIFLVPKRIPNSPQPYNTDAINPSNFAYSTMTRWWNGQPNSVDAFEPTGDNVRESPYNQLYPRLTTKSNTYTVHYRVQTLKKVPSTDPARWVEGKDSVLAEYRGSATLERYIDPHDPALNSLPQTGSDLSDPANSLDNHYSVRVVQRAQFSP